MPILACRDCLSRPLVFLRMGISVDRRRRRRDWIASSREKSFRRAFRDLLRVFRIFSSVRRVMNFAALDFFGSAINNFAGRLLREQLRSREQKS